MPPKRTTKRKQGDAAERGKSRSKGKGKGKANKVSQQNECAMVAFMVQLRQLSESKARCSAALQCCLDGTAVSDADHSYGSTTATTTTTTRMEGDRDASMDAATTAEASSSSYGVHMSMSCGVADANLLLLATHVINRLVRHLQTKTMTTTATTTTYNKTPASRTNNHASRSSSVIQTSCVLLTLCRMLATALLADRPKLERCGNANHAPTPSATGFAPRSVVARALVSACLGSVVGLEHLVGSYAPSSLSTINNNANVNATDPLDAPMIRSSLWAGLVALEQLVHLSNKPAPSLAFFHPPLDTETNIITALRTACHLVSETVLTEDDRAVLSDVVCSLDPLSEPTLTTTTVMATATAATATAATTVQSTAPVSPRKRSRRGSKKQATSPPPPNHNAVPDTQAPTRGSLTRVQLQSIRTLLDSAPTNTMPFDGRVSIRRWASMALVWLADGHPKLLDMLHSILQPATPVSISTSRITWTQLLDGTPSITTANITADPMAVPETDKAASKKSTRHKRRGVSSPPTTDENDKPTLTVTTTNNDTVKLQAPIIPGNVALVTFASRMCHVLAECGTSCGVRAPAGGMDIYVACVLSLNDSLPPPMPLLPLHSPDSVSSEPIRHNLRSHNRSVVTDVTMESNPSTPTTPSTPQQTWTRHDIRDRATIVLQLLIDRHSDCLLENYHPNNASGDDKNVVQYYLVNDGAEEDVKLYPHLHKTIDTLARAAASSVANSVFMDVSDSIERIMCICSALILGNSRTPSMGVVILDAKLMGVALRYLSQSLERILTLDPHDAFSTSSDGDDANETVDGSILSPELMAVYKLTESLLPKNHVIDEHEKKEGSSASTSCSFGGIFHPPGEEHISDNDISLHEEESSSARTRSQYRQSRLQEGDLLALFFRAMVPTTTMATATGKTKTVAHSQALSAATMLLTQLFGIIQSCSMPLSILRQNTTFPEKEEAHQTRGRKRRRKNSDGASVTTLQSRGDDQSPSPKTMTCISKEVVGKIEILRAGLATEALDVLRRCLVQSDGGRSSQAPFLKSAKALRSFIRQGLTKEHICHLIQIGINLKELMLPIHTDLTSTQGTATCTQPTTDESTTLSASDLGRLWSAHIKLSLTIGRGTPSFDSRPVAIETRSPMGDTARRLAVFQFVASTYLNKERTKEVPMDPESVDQWPLSLSKVHHALLTSNIASEPFPTTIDDASPERFLCGSFLNSLTGAFHDLNKVETAKNTFPPQPLDYDEFPVSLWDARLVTIAVGRLPAEEQTEYVQKLVDILFSALKALLQNESMKMYAEKSISVSGFIARVLTLCVTLVDVVGVGHELLQCLVKHVGSAYYQSPIADFDSNELEKSPDQSDWYRRDCSYMGLFSDWKSSTLPSVMNMVKAPEELSVEWVRKLDDVLEMSIDLGYLTADNDKCNLLFAAWSASGKSIGWDKNKRELNALAQDDDTSELTYARRAMNIRDDICMIEREITTDTSTRPDSLLSDILDIGTSKKGLSATQAQELIKQGATKAMTMLDKNVVDFSNTATTSAALSFYEMIPVFAAFTTALHTKSVESFQQSFTSNQRSRRRKKSDNDSLCEDEIMDGMLSDNESISESGYPEFEDDEEEIAARLHDACNTLGASPFHPDWLDIRCRHRDGFDSAMATEAAEKMLDALTRYGNAAYTQYMTYLYRGLLWTGGGEETRDKQLRARSALELLIAIYKDDEEDETCEIDGNLTPQISLLCQVDKNAVETTLSSLAGSCSSSHTSSTDCWCLNSAHRIRGQLQELSGSMESYESGSAEQRTAGEWELLLSDALRGTSIEIDFDIDEVEENYDEANMETEQERNPEHAFHMAERWRRVYVSAMCAMIPAASLLRFGINGGRGRQPHPLKTKKYIESESDCLDLYPSPPIPIPLMDSSYFQRSSGMGQEQRKKTVSSALTFVTSTQCDEGLRSSCRAITCHLGGKIEELEGMQYLNSLFTSLLFILDALKQNKEDVVKTEAAEQISAFLLPLIAKFSDTETTLPTWSGVERGLVGREAIMGKDTKKSKKFIRLMACLGYPSLLTMDTVAERNVHLFTVLRGNESSDEDELRDSGNLLFGEWIFTSKRKEALNILLLLLCQRSLDVQTRKHLATLLNGLADTEQDLLRSHSHFTGQAAVFMPAILDAWNGITPQDLKSLMKNDVCSSSEDRADLGRAICSVIVGIVCYFSSVSNSEDVERSGCRLVLDIALEFLSQWSNEQIYILDDFVDLLCLLALRFDALNEAFVILTSAAQKLASSDRKMKDHEDCTQQRFAGLERFLNFVRVTSNSLRSGDDSKDNAISTISGPSHGDSQRMGSMLMNRKVAASARSTSASSSGPHSSRTCTFVETGGEFFEQHWYNCYSCSLLWERGCCSICAQVCHKGHDVGYSRFSSFFCDCGAEHASAREQDRVTCKCLKPIYGDELDKVCDTISSHSPHAKYSMIPNSADIRGKVTQTISKNFPSQAEASIEHFVRDLKESDAVNLLELFNFCFKSWLEEPSQLLAVCEDDMIEKKASALSTELTTEGDSLFHEKITLSERTGKVLNLQHLEESKCFSPVCASKASCFNLKLSTETSTDRLKKAMISKNGVKRQAIVADSRGRMIVAEAGSLLFCSAVCNVHNHSRQVDSIVNRSNFSILGSSKVQFSVVGMQLCQDNERHLAVWGTSEVGVAILSASCDKVEKWIDLTVELEPQECETEYLLKCEWIPGSETMLLVCCGTFVKVFDIRRSTSGCLLDKDALVCKCCCCYTLAYEDVLIRGAALVGDKNSLRNLARSKGASELSHDDSDDMHIKVKMFLLLDTGKMVKTDLVIDARGDLEDQGENYIECGDGMAFPVAGIRRYNGASAGLPGMTVTSFGEGSSLEYLPNAGLLLYKCVSSCVVALILDDTGAFSGSFEILPHVLSSEVLGTPTDVSISAPFVHWTELGLVERNGSLFHRVSFVGKSTRTNQPKLVYAEFNQRSTSVKELSWTSGNLGLGLSLSTSFDGVCAFTRPILSAVGEENMMSCSSHERAFLVALTSNGSMLIYGEESTEFHNSSNTEPDAFSPLSRRRALSDSAVGCSDSSGQLVSFDKKGTGQDEDVAQPFFPLTIFESLLNVSGVDELFFGGDAVGSDALNSSKSKQLLSINNSDFLICNSREGCTLTASLRPKGLVKGQNQKTEISKSDSRKLSESCNKNSSMDRNGIDPTTLAIVAVRVLVGSSTTDYIPKELRVMGRKVKLMQGVKRWYGIPLTNEEILMCVRQGFISIHVGPAFEHSNSPLVDAVEVYCKKRKDLPFLLASSTLTNVEDPNSYRGFDHSRLGGEGTVRVSPSWTNLNLIRSMKVLTHFQAMGTKLVALQIKTETMQQLFRATALDSSPTNEMRNHAIDLLKEAESDPARRQIMIDEATLQGIRESLQDMRRLVTNTEVKLKELSAGVRGTKDADSTREKETIKPISQTSCMKILSVLEKCLHVAIRIARERPIIYTKSTGVSIPNDSKFIFDFCGYNMDRSNVPALIVELSLIEIAIHEQKSSWDESGFDRIANLLKSHDQKVVETCCSLMAKVLQEQKKSTPRDGVKSSEKDESTAPIAYKCDSCAMFPILEKRFTLEGRHDIDLCNKCYREGLDYAQSNDNSTEIPLVIGDKGLRLGDTSKMTCADIKQMRPMSIASTIIEDVRRLAGTTSSQSSENFVDISGEGDEDAVLQLALRMSLADESNTGAENEESVQFLLSRKDYINYILQRTLDLSDELLSSYEANKLSHPSPVIQLALNIILDTNSDEIRLERAKLMSRSIIRRLETLVGVSSQLDKSEVHRAKCNIIIGLRSLSTLLLGREDSHVASSSGKEADENTSKDTEAEVSPKTKDKTDPRFVCDVHGVPAVRRRCSHGVHKDRRFYLCGMERRQRCKYFKWADMDDSTTKGNIQLTPSAAAVSREFTDLQSYMCKLFTEPSSAGSKPLQAQLCEMLQLLYKADMLEGCTSVNGGCHINEKSHADSLPLESVRSEAEILEDWSDGVFKSQEKRGWCFDAGIHEKGDTDISGLERVERSARGVEASLVNGSLDLLAFVASNSLWQAKSNTKLPPWSSSWFSLLCEMIGSSGSANLRVQAKRMLKRLCGGRHNYHRVRDHWQFKTQLRNLIRKCDGPLQAAIDVKEKARRCGSAWKYGEGISWGSLSVGGLIGTGNLVSEDSVSMCDEELVKEMLDQLIEVTETRGENWRKFCAMSEIPQNSGNSSPLTSSAMCITGIRSSMLECPPITCLFWMGCALSGSNQVKMLKLIDIALTTGDSPKLVASTSESSTHRVHEETGGLLSTDGGTDNDTSSNKVVPFDVYDTKKLPEEWLLKDQLGLSIDEIHAFAIEFVLRGKTLELREIASQVVTKLFHNTSPSDLGNLLLRFMDKPLHEISSLGCASIEFLKLLKNLVVNVGSYTPISFGTVAQIATQCFVSQMKAISKDVNGLLPNQSDMLEKGSSDLEKLTPKLFDLIECAHCHRHKECDTSENESSREAGKINNLISSKESAGVERASSTSGVSGSGNVKLDSSTAWLPGQIKPYTKSRLDNSTENMVSTEFAAYAQLKSRYAVSEISLLISEPRGRLVKTIDILFTPGQVDDVNELKGQEYNVLWQKCGTLSLQRGSSRATCKLKKPIIAANLKFEYAQFWEKLGGSRSSDGGLMLHCPRCTRVVNNAHGVCGHCGEVAFQCRKCRHINYDRLDAFLCVECNYCASGSFSFEVTSGLASNAVAITDEEGLDRTIRLLRASNRRLEEVRNTLRKKLLIVVASRRKRARGDWGTLESIINSGPPPKRALLDDKCLNVDARGDERAEGSGVDASAKRRAQGSRKMSSANKARTLLSLARQLRSEASGSNENDRTGRMDLSLRQDLLNGGGGSGFDYLDEGDSDIFGILNSRGEGSSLNFESGPDPLSRLVANIQARVRSSALAGDRTGLEARLLSSGLADVDADQDDDEEVGEEGNGIRRSNQSAKKSYIEACELLHHQMREAEKECHELQTRITAWECLNNDDLGDKGSLKSLASFPRCVPSVCSVCSGALTLHLLVVVMTVFDADFEKTKSALTVDFVRSLFEEPQTMTTQLFDLKRLAIITLARNSKRGARLVLDELKRRLDFSHDRQSAEILGKLIESDFSLADEYVAFALEVLDHGQ